MRVPDRASYHVFKSTINRQKLAIKYHQVLSYNLFFHPFPIFWLCELHTQLLSWHLFQGHRPYHTTGNVQTGVALFQHLLSPLQLNHLQYQSKRHHHLHLLRCGHCLTAQLGLLLLLQIIKISVVKVVEVERNWCM